jgi:hypothetical protein
MSAAGQFPARLTAAREADRFEVVAAMAVEALASDVTLGRLDPGGGRTQLADFRFTSADGRDLGRLEITTTTRRTRSSFIKEVSRHRWHFPDLTWSWSVHVRESARVSTLRQKIAPLLAQLERDSRTGEWIPAQPGLDPADPGALPPDLASLGVLAAYAAHKHTAGDTALVSVVPHMGGGAFSRNAAAWEVQAELDKPDNRAKLQIPGATRSELFVWLDAGNGQAALSTLATPPFDQTLADVPVLNLPPGITGAWMASGLAAWPRPVATLFHCDGHHWQKMTPPELDYNDAGLEAMLARLLP